jgi:hypothetical protein
MQQFFCSVKCIKIETAILILDASHDMNVSDIPLDPPSKGDFILKIPPSRRAEECRFFKMRIAEIKKDPLWATSRSAGPCERLWRDPP